MGSDLVFSPLTLLALLWLCLLLQWAWPRATAACSTPPAPPPPAPQRTRAPQLFAGLTHRPHCDACAQATDSRPQAPAAPPPRLMPTRGRRRQVDTTAHFCPNPDCQYRGWAGWGNIRANGHPGGGRWRQLLCIVCRRYFLETLGTLFHGKRVAPELIVRVLACLAEDFLPFVNPNLSNFPSSARPAHGDFGWHHSRCDHAASRSGDAAAGLQCCVKLGHAAGLWSVEPYTRRRNRPHVAWRLAPCDTGHGASAGRSIYRAL
jgi:hypothetical protein